MNRSLWTQTFTEWYSPPFPCPACGKGVLSLVPKSLVYQETAKSRRAHHDEDWSFQDAEYRFTARLKCGHSSCGDEVVMLGTGWIDEQMTQEGSEPTNYFSAKFCVPMPDIVAIPQKCPAPVASELRASFALFWADRAAAANRIRAGVERIMDHFGIPKRQRNKKGRFDPLYLHGRLKRFEKTDKIIADRLMAIKWLGNTGSHQSDEVTRDDILDALEILEDALVELFDQRTRRLAALTRSLMRRHEPSRKRKLTRPLTP